MSQHFRADTTFTFPNGAIGWRLSGPFDCLGPFAKVENCPIKGTIGPIRRTAYATNYADSYFSVPANTRYHGRYIKGFFSQDSDGGIWFHPMDTHKHLLPMEEVSTPTN